ncbi:MAG: hypothetical protein JNN11_01220 [Candidatus Doudnabacteria bacterium]|nr:hypothetical protein [Candidatus Doudnabacteria bacterium]
MVFFAVSGEAVFMSGEIPFNPIDNPRFGDSDPGLHIGDPVSYGVDDPDQTGKKKADAFSYSSLDQVVADNSPKGEDWQETFSATSGNFLKAGSKEWHYKDPEGKEASLTESLKGSEEGLRHSQIVEELFSQGWSTVEYMDRFSGNLVREVYFADEKGQISFKAYELKPKPSEEDIVRSLLEEVMEDMDDEDSEDLTHRHGDTVIDITPALFTSSVALEQNAAAKDTFWEGLFNTQSKAVEKEQNAFGVVNFMSAKEPEQKAGIYVETKPVEEMNFLELFASEPSVAFEAGQVVEKSQAENLAESGITLAEGREVELVAVAAMQVVQKAEAKPGSKAVRQNVKALVPAEPAFQKIKTEQALVSASKASVEKLREPTKLKITAEGVITLSDQEDGDIGKAELVGEAAERENSERVTLAEFADFNNLAEQEVITQEEDMATSLKESAENLPSEERVVQLNAESDFGSNEVTQEDIKKYGAENVEDVLVAKENNIFEAALEVKKKDILPIEIQTVAEGSGEEELVKTETVLSGVVLKTEDANASVLGAGEVNNESYAEEVQISLMEAAENRVIQNEAPTEDVEGALLEPALVEDAKEVPAEAIEIKQVEAAEQEEVQGGELNQKAVEDIELGISLEERLIEAQPDAALAEIESAIQNLVEVPSLVAEELEAKVVEPFQSLKSQIASKSKEILPERIERTQGSRTEVFMPKKLPEARTLSQEIRAIKALGAKPEGQLRQKEQKVQTRIVKPVGNLYSQRQGVRSIREARQESLDESKIVPVKQELKLLSKLVLAKPAQRTVRSRPNISAAKNVVLAFKPRMATPRVATRSKPVFRPAFFAARSKAKIINIENAPRPKQVTEIKKPNESNVRLKNIYEGLRRARRAGYTAGNLADIAEVDSARSAAVSMVA